MNFVEAEDAVIREHYITKHSEEIAKLLGRNKNSVISRAQCLMRKDEAFRKIVSQRVADKNVAKLKAAHEAGKLKAWSRVDRLLGKQVPPPTPQPQRVALPPEFKLPDSDWVHEVKPPERPKRPAPTKRRCSYFHYNAAKGRSAQCAEFAVKGSAWCPECAARIAELRASA